MVLRAGLKDRSVQLIQQTNSELKKTFQTSLPISSIIMGADEKFCLRWNDFESNISLAFREIREEKDFFDCTLSCGSRQIQAHKLILSACSPFFRSILKQNPHQHPLLYLKGVQFTDLQAILNFMYHGEVNVAQEELNSFLAIAEDLQVKGLTQGNSNPCKNSKTSLANQTTAHKKPKPPKEPELFHPVKNHQPLQGQPLSHLSYQQRDIVDDEIQEILPIVKREPVILGTVDPAPTTMQPVTGGSGTMDMQMVNMDSYEEGVDDYEGYDGVDTHGFDSEASQNYEHTGELYSYWNIVLRSSP